MVLMTRTRLLLLLVVSLAAQQPLLAQDSIFDDGLGDTTAGPGTGLDDIGGDLGTPEDDPRAQYEAKLQAAEQTRESGDYQNALTAYQELEQLGGANPAQKDPRVLYGIAFCHQQLDATDLAISYYSQVLVSRQSAQVPGLLEAVYINRGQLYINVNRYREAVEDLTDARAANPQNAEAAMLFGSATLRSAVTSPGGGLDQAGQATINGAVTALKDAIEIQPDYGEAYLERGRALMRLRLVEYAVTDFESAVQYLGPDSAAAAELGTAYAMRAGQQASRADVDRTKVIQDYRAALRAMDGYLASAQFGDKPAPWDTSDPFDQIPERVMLSRADAKIALANELEAEERTELYKSAISDADRMAAIPDAQDEIVARAQYLRGVGYRMLGDLQQAADAFTKAIQVYSAAGARYSDAYLRRGICYFHLGEYEKARQDFGDASTVPTNPYVYEPRAMFWAGLTYAKMEDYENAIRSYTRALKSAPRYTSALLNRGLAYLNMGRFDRAIEDFDVVLRQYPGHSEASMYRDLAAKQRDQ